MWLVLCPPILDTHPAGHGGRRGGCCPFRCHDTRQCFHNTAFLLSGQADLDGFPCMMLVRLEGAQGPLGIAMLSFVCESLSPAQARLVQKHRLRIKRGRSWRKTRGLNGRYWMHWFSPFFPSLCGEGWVSQVQGLRVQEIQAAAESRVRKQEMRSRQGADG